MRRLSISIVLFITLLSISFSAFAASAQPVVTKTQAAVQKTPAKVVIATPKPTPKPTIKPTPTPIIKEQNKKTITNSSGKSAMDIFMKNIKDLLK